MPGRKYEAQSGYRYGFNGKEKDKDMNGLTAYDYGFRIYNPGIGKFLSVDPLTKKFPDYTPFQFCSNNPIIAIDIDGLESSEDKKPTAQLPSNTPSPTPTKLYTGAMSYDHVVTIVNIPHNHTDFIKNDIYPNTGGDDEYIKNRGVLDKMNKNMQPVIPGTILSEEGNNNASTNQCSAYYSASESGSEKAWVNVLLGGFMTGEVPENIVFSENGTVSNYLKGGNTYKNLIKQFYLRGMPDNDNTLYGLNYGVSDAFGDLASSGAISLPSFVGSAYGTVLANPNTNTVIITITNYTSINSGDYEKDTGILMGMGNWHTDSAPFLHRDPSNQQNQPYTNFSQTYRYKYTLSEFKKELQNRFTTSRSYSRMPWNIY